MHFHNLIWGMYWQRRPWSDCKCESKSSSAYAFAFAQFDTGNVLRNGNVLTDREGPDQTFYEGESISNQPNLFQVEIHLFFFDVIAL